MTAARVFSPPQAITVTTANMVREHSAAPGENGAYEKRAPRRRRDRADGQSPSRKGVDLLTRRGDLSRPFRASTPEPRCFRVHFRDRGPRHACAGNHGARPSEARHRARGRRYRSRGVDDGCLRLCVERDAVSFLAAGRRGVGPLRTPSDRAPLEPRYGTRLRAHGARSESRMALCRQTRVGDHRSQPVLGQISLRLPFWAAASLSLLNASYGFFVLPESLPRERRANIAWAKANPLASIALLRSEAVLFGLAVVAFLDYVAHESLPSCFV